MTNMCRITYLWRGFPFPVVYSCTKRQLMYTEPADLRSRANVVTTGTYVIRVAYKDRHGISCSSEISGFRRNAYAIRRFWAFAPLQRRWILTTSCRATAWEHLILILICTVRNCTVSVSAISQHQLKICVVCADLQFLCAVTPTLRSGNIINLKWFSFLVSF